MPFCRSAACGVPSSLPWRSIGIPGCACDRDALEKQCCVTMSSSKSSYQNEIFFFSSSRGIVHASRHLTDCSKVQSAAGGTIKVIITFTQLPVALICGRETCHKHSLTEHHSLMTTTSLGYVRPASCQLGRETRGRASSTERCYSTFDTYCRSRNARP